MDNLKEFQVKMPDGFDSIAVDITGFCNANCKYCPSGRRFSPYVEKRFISLERFEEILKKLLEYRFYTPATNFHIYAQGEPCLHPQLNDILKLLSDYHITTTISTNASVVPDFEREAFKSVSRFLISVPGFSQASYDKIHGFQFETVKANIIKLREQAAELSDKQIPFDMSYHIYQFNEREMVPAREFCREHDIRFAPNYAVMMDKDKCLDYVRGTMSFEELKDVSKDVFLGVLDQQIKDAPMDYCDFQSRFLSVTIDGDIRICSGFTKAAESGILVGNIVTDGIDDIIWRKYHHPRCETCIKAGLTLSKGYECKVYPDGYYDLMKENDYTLAHMKDGKLQEKLRLLKLVRQFEQEEYAENLRKSIRQHIEKHNLWNDVEDIARNYTRFGVKTCEKLGL